MKDELEALIAMLYEATLNPSLWPVALEKVRTLVRAKHAAITFHDAHDKNRSQVMTAGATFEHERLYLANYVESDVKWLRKVFGSVEEGVVIQSADFEHLTGLTRIELLGSHIDFFRLARLEQHAYSLPIKADSILSAFSVHRELDGDRFSQQELDLLNTLSKHMRRALRIFYQLASVQKQNESLLSTMSHMPHGALLLDSEFRIILGNQEAQRIFGHHPALKLGQCLQRLSGDICPLPQRPRASLHYPGRLSCASLWADSHGMRDCPGTSERLLHCRHRQTA